MSTNRIGSNTPKTNLPPSSGNVGQDGVSKAEESNAASALSSLSPGSAASPKKLAKGNFDVNISTGAKDRASAFQKAFDIAQQTPDIREDRVKALKEQIQNGSYKVDAGNIADSMLREAVKEHLAESDNR